MSQSETSPVAPLRIIRPRDISPGIPRQPKPAWLKVRAPGSPNYLRLKGLMKELRLNTVCEEARCPNIGECWNHGTATFMILGDVCTRACGYCAVPHGMPTELDAAEPARVAHAIATMALKYVVITSVDRDDLADGGAWIFAETIGAVRATHPECRVEVARRRLEQAFGDGLPGRQVTPGRDAGRDPHEAVAGLPASDAEVGDRLGEGPHATGCEHPGVERRPVNDLHQAGRRDGLLEVGRIFDADVWHGPFFPTLLHTFVS